jgi:hypothetical protein
VREIILRCRLFFFVSSLIPSCQCYFPFPFRLQTFAAFIACCTLVFPQTASARAYARHVAHARSSHAFGACCRDGDNTRATTTTTPLIFSIHFCFLYYHLHLLLLLLRVVPLALFVHFF